MLKETRKESPSALKNEISKNDLNSLKAACHPSNTETNKDSAPSSQVLLSNPASRDLKISTVSK
jgi:hypothetical protein